MTVDQLKGIFAQKGYVWNPLINVIGVRNLAMGRRVTNKFDDMIYVAYKELGSWHLFSAPITSDPGSYYVRKKLLNPKGVAILKAGQHLNVYAIRLHQGKYEALCQTYGPVTVYRDANKDETYDLKVTESGSFGINIHKAGSDSQNVDNWSAGCQVFKRGRDFDGFMKIIRAYKERTKNIFTYTLLEL